MELNEQEKARIVAEEKLRHETRRQLMREECCHGHRCGGRWRIGFKVLIVALIVSAFAWHCHSWHDGPGGGYTHGTSQ